MSVNQPTNPPPLASQSLPAQPSTIPNTESEGNAIATTIDSQEPSTAINDDEAPPKTAEDNIESTSPIINTATTTPSTPQPVVRISLLLTTGTRHAMTLTKGSLKKKGFLPEDNDPYSLTVYQLKQMIFNDWRSGTVLGVKGWQNQKHILTHEIRLARKAGFSGLYSTDFLWISVGRYASIERYVDL
jgi:hypothetical protein